MEGKEPGPPDDWSDDVTGSSSDAMSGKSSEDYNPDLDSENYIDPENPYRN